MKFNFSHYFHHLTTDRSDGGDVSIPDNPSHWPAEWREVAYKEYNFFKALPLPATTGYFFDTLISQRSSDSGRLLENQVSLSDIAYILQSGYGLLSGVFNPSTASSRRTVPSAGGQYPLEMYAVLFDDLPSIPSGIYHYGVRQHALEIVQQRAFTEEDKRTLSPLPWFVKSRGLFCISAVFRRSIGKYGTRGYRYMLLEAGHVAQNMQLAATERKAVLVPVGGVEDCLIEQVMGLDDSRERLIYCLCW